MGQQCADVCDRCGKTVVKESEEGSSDMVRVERLELLYLSDEYLPGRLSRPCLDLSDEVYCPDCLAEQIAEWIGEIKKLGASPDVMQVKKV